MENTYKVEIIDSSKELTAREKIARTIRIWRSPLTVM